jgi:hypothetical protein
LVHFSKHALRNMDAGAVEKTTAMGLGLCRENGELVLPVGAGASPPQAAPEARAVQPAPFFYGKNAPIHSVARAHVERKNG